MPSLAADRPRSPGKSLRQTKSSDTNVGETYIENPDEMRTSKCPKTCPKHRTSGVYAKKPVQQNIPTWQYCKPCQREMIQCKPTCRRNPQKPANENEKLEPIYPVQKEPGTFLSLVPDRGPPQSDSLKKFQVPTKDTTQVPTPKKVCNLGYGGDLREICEAYQKIECKDTVWTVKIMKDSAVTAKSPETPAMVQTSITTIITADKLESLLPTSNRYVDESTEIYLNQPNVCIPCVLAAQKNASHSPEYAKNIKPEPYSDSGNSSCCFCCGRKSKKKKKKSGRESKKKKKKSGRENYKPPEVLNGTEYNCTDNYIS